MKNKNSKIVLLFALALSMVSFTTLKEKEINVKKSDIQWTGYKVTGQHEGTINLKSGKLIFEGKTLIGGSFIIDMLSINTTDLQGDYKNKLDGHLKSDDFFSVEKHPTASLKITSANGDKGVYNVNADITIKGITKPINFTMVIENNTASAKLKIDRTKHKITYKSPSIFESIKDKAIYDEFDLNVNLTF